MKNKNNILYIPATIDPDSINDKAAYFINYLYTYSFEFKEQMKLKVLKQKRKIVNNVSTENLDLIDFDSSTPVKEAHIKF